MADLLEVVCLTCNGLVVASCRGGVPAAEGLLLAAHYNEPHHNPHGLMLRVGGELPGPGQTRLELHCRAPACSSRFPRSLTYCGQPHLVSAMAICFHSMHEGHPLSMAVDGVLLFPPCP